MIYFYKSMWVHMEWPNQIMLTSYSVKCMPNYPIAVDLGLEKFKLMI